MFLMQLEIKGKVIEYDDSFRYLDIANSGKIIELDFEQLKNERYLGERLDAKLQVIYCSLVTGETFSVDSLVGEEREKIDEDRRKGLVNTAELYKKIFDAIAYEKKESIIHEKIYRRRLN